MASCQALVLSTTLRAAADCRTLLTDCFSPSEPSEKVSHHHPAPEHLFFSFLPFTDLHLISSRKVYGVYVFASSPVLPYPLLGPRLRDVTSPMGQFQRTSLLCGASGFKLPGVRAKVSCPCGMLTATCTGDFGVCFKVKETWGQERRILRNGPSQGQANKCRLDGG